MKKMQLLDNYSHEFNESISNQIKKYITIEQCKFCGGGFLSYAGYYKHDGGWMTSLYPDKIWIWFTCDKCGHQWSISHLGVKRDIEINIH